MTIEFHTAYGKINEKLITNIRNELLALSHTYKAIHKAEVIMRIDEAFITDQNKICEISLSFSGELLCTRARTQNFETSTQDALKKLKQMVTQHDRKHRETNYAD